MDELNEAIHLYVGVWPHSKEPSRQPRAVFGRFGEERGRELVAHIDVIVDEMYDCPRPQFHPADPGESYSDFLADTYQPWLMARYPELDPEAATALTTIYVHGWRHAANMDERSEAVYLYLGFGPKYYYPKTSEQAVMNRFGDGCGWDLLAYAKSIVAETNSFHRPEYVRSEDSHHSYEQWLGATYRAWVEEHHPELHPETIRALGTAYAFWWR